VSYGASNALAKQIEAGAPADLFISADLDWMDYVDKKGLVTPGTRVDLLRNTLVLVAPATSQSTLKIGPGFDLAAYYQTSAQAGGDYDNVKVVYLSPQGEPLRHARVAKLAAEPGLILLAGRYEGVDERLLEKEIDLEVSIGDFVVSGGELPALLLIDAIVRQLPGVLNDAQSNVEESFVDGLLDCPHYTRPELLEDGVVPAVLLSGNHAEIARWRRKQSLGRTWLRRPDLLAEKSLSAEDAKLLEEFKREGGGRAAGK